MIPNIQEVIKHYPEFRGVHPACLAVPIVSEEEFRDIVADIAENGLLEPLIRKDGLLIDGRTRLLACYESNTEIRVKDHVGNADPWTLVHEWNILRRHLTVGQKAMYADEWRADEERKAKERRGSNQHQSKVETLPPCDIGKARDKVGERVGVSGKSVDKARTIKEVLPQVAEQVRSGSMSLESGYKEARKAIHEKASLPKEDPVPVSTCMPMVSIVTAKGVVTEIAQPNRVVFNRTNDSVDWASFTWNPVTGCEHGCRFCLDPETPVLKLDMTWCPIGELVIGDSLLGFDEHGRKVLRESIVEDKWNVATEDAYEIVAGGRTVVCSGNHKWLTSGGKWVETRRLTLGHKIVDTGYSIGKNRSLSYSAGYVAGCLGGDGTFRFPGDESDSGQVWARVAATDIEVLKSYTDELRKLGVDLDITEFNAGQPSGVCGEELKSPPKKMRKVETRARNNLSLLAECMKDDGTEDWAAGWLAGYFDTDGSYSGGNLRFSYKNNSRGINYSEVGVNLLDRIGIPSVIEANGWRVTEGVLTHMKFFQITQPVLSRKKAAVVGTGISTVRSTVQVSSVRLVGKRDLVDITTSTRTFIAHGLATHNCYAREIAVSSRMSPYYPNGFEPTYHQYRLSAPKNTKKPVSDDPRDGRVFVCSMADLFGKWVPDEWINNVFKACLESPQWEYLFLTKWPARYAKMPLLEKAWYGASVIQQSDVRRVESAMKDFETPCVKWISLEPMLTPIRFDDLSWCNLVVIGAQTSTNQPDGFVPEFAPEFDWVVDVVNQCRTWGVPYYLKENLGLSRPGMKLPKGLPS